MRVFISVDMEGVAGVVHDDQTNPAHADYARYLDLMTRECNAAIEGAPVVLFTGDAAAVSEMHSFVTEVEGVVVKEGLSTKSARSLHPEESCSRIRTGACRAVERLQNIPPLRLEGRAELEIDFTTPGK